MAAGLPSGDGLDDEASLDHPRAELDVFRCDHDVARPALLRRHLQDGHETGPHPDLACGGPMLRLGSAVLAVAGAREDALLELGAQEQVAGARFEGNGIRHRALGA